MSTAELRLYKHSIQMSYGLIGVLIVSVFTFGGAWFEFRQNTAELKEIKETIKVIITEIQEDHIRLQELDKQVQALQKFSH